MKESQELRQKYDQALEQFLERVKQDSSILAVYVYGSFVNRTLAPHSDIDMFIITNDDRTSGSFLVLRENDVLIEADLLSRTEFRKQTQGFVHGGSSHHLLATAKLIYSADKTITEIGRDLIKVAERDKELQLMLRTEMLVGCFLKAQKTLWIEKNPEKSFLWFPRLCLFLAYVILLMNDIIPGRDVLVQARELDNELFNRVIKKTLVEEFSEENLGQALNLVEHFLVENKKQLYKPLFSYLSEAGDARSASEIDLRFRRAFGDLNMFSPWVESLEWLTQQGDLMRAIAPVRITSKSRVTAEEATFYYLGDD